MAIIHNHSDVLARQLSFNSPLEERTRTRHLFAASTAFYRGPRRGGKREIEIVDRELESRGEEENARQMECMGRPVSRGL